MLHWDQWLHVPSNIGLSEPAVDLIKMLIVSADRRLGSSSGGAEHIKKHAFFNKIDFSKKLRRQPAPYRPRIQSELDTSNFDKTGFKGDDSGDEANDGKSGQPNGSESGKTVQHSFYEFTFKRFFDDGGHPLRADNYINVYSNNHGSNNAEGVGGTGSGLGGPANPSSASDGQIAAVDAVFV